MLRRTTTFHEDDIWVLIGVIGPAGIGQDGVRERRFTTTETVLIALRCIRAAGWAACWRFLVVIETIALAICPAASFTDPGSRKGSRG